MDTTNKIEPQTVYALITDPLVKALTNALQMGAEYFSLKNELLYALGKAADAYEAQRRQDQGGH